MPEITAGAVSLDLVIKDTLNKQLDDIKSRLESALGKISESAAGKAAASAERTSSAAGEAVKKAEKAVNNLDFSKVEKNIGKMTAAMETASDSIRKMNNYL
jgi:hypothetical protein